MLNQSNATLPNILLIEDDNVDILSIKNCFNKLNIKHNLYIASSGVDALKMLEDKILKPDLFILDINMPKMNGFEFLNELHKKNINHFSNIVIVTTSSSPSDIEKANKFNIKHYLLKPINSNQFIKIYKEIVS